MKKKVLILTDTLKPRTGWGTVSHYLNKELRQFYDVETLVLPLPLLNSPLTFILNPISLFLTYLKHRKKFEGVDYVICVCEPLQPIVSYAKGSFKSVLIGHGTYIYFPYVRGLSKFFNRWAFSKVDTVVVPSHYTQSRLQEWTDKESHVVFWGIDLERYKRPTKVKKENYFVTMAGQLKERKGISYLIKAFAKLTKEYPNYSLHLLGKVQQQYLDLVEELGVKDNVIFHGHVLDEELLELYGKAFCQVLPSVNTDDAFEGFGLVHLEANAYGIPTIGSRDSANDDVIKHGVSGYLCNQRDVDDLYKTMKAMIEDKKSYAKMKSNAREYARKFSWSKTARDVHSILKRLS